MKTIQQNLTKYLSVEKLLNILFEHFNYCFTQCIEIEIIKNDGQPVSACCKDKYYKKYDLEHPVFELLKGERERLYGTPDEHHFDNPVSPCEYHNPKTGCILPTHKSPICLAFMCQESIGYLRKHYNIFEYDYLGVNYALEWILTDDFSEKDYVDFEKSITSMIQKIIAKNI